MADRKPYFKEDGTLVLPLPEFMETMSIDEQIVHQVKLHLEKYPEDKVMMIYTYDKNREPKLQRQAIEI